MTTNLIEGKEYMIYGSISIPNSRFAVELTRRSEFGTPYPIFVCGEGSSDAPSENFINLNLGPDANYDDLARGMIESPDVKKIIDGLLKRQGNVKIKLWKNDPAFSPLFTESVSYLGLSPEQSNTFNNKIWQYNALKDLVLVPPHIITTKQDALKSFSKVASDRGVVSSLPYSAGGSGVRIHGNSGSLNDYLASPNGDVPGEFILMPYLPVKSSPAIDFIIANPEEVICYGLADQVFKNTKDCIGVTYPSLVNEDIRECCYHTAAVVTNMLASRGYVGYGNMDFIVADGRVYLSEINARLPGAVGNRMWMMEKTRPASYPSIADLEFMATTQQTFNGFLRQGNHLPWPEPDNFWWLKMEITADKKGYWLPKEDMPSDPDEVYISGKGCIHVGQPYPRIILAIGDEIGNLVCTAGSSEELEAMSRTARVTIQRSIMGGRPHRH